MPFSIGFSRGPPNNFCTDEFDPELGRYQRICSTHCDDKDNCNIHDGKTWEDPIFNMDDGGSNKDEEGNPVELKCNTCETRNGDDSENCENNPGLPSWSTCPPFANFACFNVHSFPLNLSDNIGGDSQEHFAKGCSPFVFETDSPVCNGATR